MTGRYSNLGEAARNGLLLAIEDINQSGGINGRKVELLIRNDSQDESSAIQGINELAAENVAAIVGPMTSSMASVVLPIANSRGISLVSPTATSTALEGLDDALFRMLPSDPDSARQLAAYAYASMKVRSVTLLLESSNRSYSQSMGDAFREAFTRQGGNILESAWFVSGEATSKSFIAARLKGRPDALMLIGSAVEIARLGQIAREISPSITLLGDTSDEMLLKIGGKSLERYVATQPFDRNGTSPQFHALSLRYADRYKQPLGFTALVSYDCGIAIMEALRRKKKDETLHSSLLRNSPFPGIQEDVAFDRFGDSHRNSQLVTIADGAFKVVK